MTIDITEKTFEQTIEKGIVLIDWWASWCGPCRAFAPIYERAEQSHPDIVFGKIDTEVERGLAAVFEIQSIPTLMAFRDGILGLSNPCGNGGVGARARGSDKVDGRDLASS